jgi:DNA-3-methyladenine glycosylase
VRLPPSFYRRPTLTVARELLGKVLVHTRDGLITSGAIVEVEAYIGEDDPACHAATGPTARNAPLYGAPGLVYVYLNYGIHALVNAVTEDEGRPAAVLIRALDPIDGIDIMRERRAQAAKGRRPRSRASVGVHDLCRGPGNLTMAMGITLDENQMDLESGSLGIVEGGLTMGAITSGPRIGIRVGTERPWRLWVSDHPAVSGPARLNAAITSTAVRRRRSTSTV